MGPTITGVEVHQFTTVFEDMGTDYNGFNAVYTPGGRLEREMYALRILTDQGITGEWVGGGVADFATLPMFSGYLIGKDALE